jgi:hypothetical protein
MINPKVMDYITNAKYATNQGLNMLGISTKGRCLMGNLEKHFLKEQELVGGKLTLGVGMGCLYNRDNRC